MGLTLLGSANNVITDTSLELWWLIEDLVFCYRVLHNLVSINPHDTFELNTNRITRGHTIKLILPKFNTNTRK